MRRVAGPVVLCVLVGGLLVGCTGAGDASSADEQFSDSAASEQGPAGGDGGGESGAGAGVVGAVDGATAVDRQVVTTGSIGVVVEDPAAAAQRASVLTEAAGGRVDTRVEQAASGDQPASARLVVRIPAAVLTPTVDELKALGTVERVELTATDVTDAVQDLDARISALTVSVGRLEALMGAASSSTDLVALESALSSRQSDLESMQSQRAGLAGQVALSTISLELTAVPTVAASGPSGFWSGVSSGWNALLAMLAAALVVVGVTLPWLVFLGLIGAAALAAVRIWRRRVTGRTTALGGATGNRTPI